MNVCVCGGGVYLGKTILSISILGDKTVSGIVGQRPFKQQKGVITEAQDPLKA